MDILGHIRGRIQDDIAAVKEDMAKGAADTYDKYREQVGMIRALRRTLSVLDEMSKNMREDGDNE